MAEHEKQQQAAPDAAAIEARIRAQVEAEYREKEAALRAELGDRSAGERTDKEREKRIATLQGKKERTERERLELALLTEGGSILHGGQVYASVEELPEGFDKQGGAK